MTETAQAFMTILSEGFGLRTMDPEVLYRAADYDMRRKQDYDVRRQNHSQSATVADLQRVANEVFAKHHVAVTLVRVLENNGFVVSVILPPGNYGGTAFPSVPALDVKSHPSATPFSRPIMTP